MKLLRELEFTQRDKEMDELLESKVERITTEEKQVGDGSILEEWNYMIQSKDNTYVDMTKDIEFKIRDPPEPKRKNLWGATQAKRRSSGNTDDGRTTLQKAQDPKKKKNTSWTVNSIISSLFCLILNFVQ